MKQEVHVDVAERGADRGGEKQTLNRRLFMQLQVFSGCLEPAALVADVERSGVEGVLYQDVNDPRGIGLLGMSDDPAFFVTTQRDLLNSTSFRTLTHRPDYTMLGRTYSSGYERDLEDWLLCRPRRTVLNPQWKWAIWYPLRRSGTFAQLEQKEQGAIVGEHAAIGRAYGEADLAHDIRLACHGMDARDNEFVIGLIGADLHPLSHIVQAMRKTQQTSQYIQSMGPFFVGHALWQSPYSRELDTGSGRNKSDGRNQSNR
ncbi:MAG: chlorite dismutase family protein [Acidobacteria bacterium]|nr:chlorite dismutase family protein [Acidobacteriota bacterium]